MMSSRLFYFTGFILTALFLSGSFYLQYFQGVVPCPLCILQRICLGLLGVVFFFGALSSLTKMNRLLTSLTAFIISLLGASLAARQIWLQHLPKSAFGDCEASVHYLFQVLPWHEAVKHIFMGGSECSKVDWTFLNMSLPTWSFIVFLFFILFSIAGLFRKK